MATGKSFQKCPVCGTANDVSVYVSGQRTRCAKCNIAFTVQRPDTPQASRAPSQVAQGSRPPAPPPPAPGDDTMVVQPFPQLPGFEIIEVIGKGGMGTVYKARQVSLNRVVAIKILAHELAVDKDFIDRFNREASALAKLSHPNIVPIIDKGSHEGVYYFVMDFVQGNTLRDMLRGNRLPPEDAVKISLQVCRAIAHAHANGVVHRDMKPENVLLDREQNVRIADFGLADIVGFQTWGTLTGSGMAMGTAHYMAPEQRRDAKRVDRRADIYSMGIMVYEMLTGEIPQGHFKKPSEHTAGIPTSFDRIVIKCLQTSPDDRYQSAEDLAKDIRAAIPAPAVEPAAPAPIKPVPVEPKAVEPQPARPSPAAPQGTPADGGPRVSERAEIRPISVRRQKLRRLRLVAFAAGALVLAVAAVFVVRACMG
ncbi:MAG: serine/threonine protein kinase [Deltaproteobacteria bacterium]|nr:serine/threonine protein kinase [Deltaproteobacteria bacterium]